MKKTLASIIALILLASCSSVPLKKQAEEHRLALVLGGGGARGFAHVGVIRELEKEKIPIHLIVGVSVGSLVGALYAETIVAVDLRTGSRFVFTRGPVREAICASSALPGVFEPVVYGEKLLVDGGVLGNLPPEVAEELGADVVVGVNIAKQRSDFSQEPPGLLTVILESIGIMGDELVRMNRDRFDVLIQPEVGNVGIMDFDRKRELMESGRQAAQKEIPRIKEIMGL